MRKESLAKLAIVVQYHFGPPFKKVWKALEWVILRGGR